MTTDAIFTYRGVNTARPASENDRDHTPWYPTMRLFTQPRLGDWASVIRQVAVELRIFAARDSD